MHPTLEDLAGKIEGVLNVRQPNDLARDFLPLHRNRIVKAFDLNSSREPFRMMRLPVPDGSGAIRSRVQRFESYLGNVNAGLTACDGSYIL